MIKISRMCIALGGIIAAGMIVLLIAGCPAAQSATYTVTYDGNGNTGGNVPADDNAYSEGEAVTVLENTGQLVKTGYSFAGWNTAADTTGTGYAEGETFVMGSEDAVLYAAWSDGSSSNPVTGLTLNRTSLTLEPGSAVQLTAAITPPDAANPAISWASDAPDIASVDPDGVVTAAAEGSAEITAGSAENPDIFDTCTVTVRVPAWGTAVLIETDDAGNAGNPQIAVDEDGNAIAVWQQHDGVRYNIRANCYTPSGGWGTAELIETDDAGDATNPQVAVDGAGNGIAVWHQWDDTRTNIWANRYTPTGGWGTAELIETDDSGGAYDPQIELDAAGNAIAVWQQHDGVRYNIRANCYTPSGGWGTAELIETDDGNVSGPQVAVDDMGNAITVWNQHDGNRYNIWANRYTPTGGWGSAELIETDDAGNAENPQVAVDENGNAIAVWHQSDGSRDNIWANRYTPSGGWGTAELLETDDAGGAWEPQIAVDVAGNAIAVWTQFDGIRYNIRANHYSPGAGWGTALPVETDEENHQNPQIAVNGGGDALAVWRNINGTRYDIRACRYTAGSWGAPTRIGEEVGGHSTKPQIGINTAGNGVAVWQQNDGTRSDIWANSFE